ncbi:MAG: hypothetical protein U9N63_08095 [Pseudomonadota bacterium]|nr:hypothetical protein [Pseudomonadota bacterium]
MKKRGKKVIWGMILALTLVFANVGSSIAQREMLGPQGCWVPYNLNCPEWLTGIHIVTFLTLVQGESVRAEFYDIITGELYAAVSVPLNASGAWTGLVQDLLSSPADFRSGSLVVFYSTAGFFSTTQFIMNTGSANPGFGFQTFYSEPVPELPVL